MIDLHRSLTCLQHSINVHQLIHLFLCLISYNSVQSTFYFTNIKIKNSVTLQELPAMRLVKDLLSPHKYDAKNRPTLNHSTSIKIQLNMSLYQIADVNEPSQMVTVNMWMIQNWVDELLDWDPRDYGMINTTILPYSSIWYPDTYVYNSMVMSSDDIEKLDQVKVTTRFWERKPGAICSMLYPALYSVTCRIDVRFFPYDQQNCTLHIGSWTNDMPSLDYYADSSVNMESFITNDEWDVISFEIHRHEYKFACCENPWAIIEASLVVRRKSLYYIINLVIPTSIITTVSIIGFFTAASTSDDRTEKINLGITTLLAMSIMMLMISDQMPITSEFIPLIAWFYLAIIGIISCGTICTCILLNIHCRSHLGRPPPKFIRVFFFRYVSNWLYMKVPLDLKRLWNDHKDMPRKKKSLINLDQNCIEKLKDESNWKKSFISLAAEKTKDLSRRKNSLFAINSCSVDENSKSLQQECKIPIEEEKHVSDSKWKNISLRIRRSSNSFGNSLFARKSHAREDPSNERTKNAFWNTALAVSSSIDTSGGLKKDKKMKSELLVMREKRQFTLEWEFLATILDRILLIIHLILIFIVTLGLVLIGRMKQYHWGSQNLKT